MNFIFRPLMTSGDLRGYQCQENKNIASTNWSHFAQSFSSFIEGKVAAQVSVQLQYSFIWPFITRSQFFIFLSSCGSHESEFYCIIFHYCLTSGIFLEFIYCSESVYSYRVTHNFQSKSMIIMTQPEIV